jgi:CBS-domain-containing membrane protein
MTGNSNEVLVPDLMTNEIITCPGDTRLAAAGLLARRRVHAVFVLDEPGHPAGVISDIDLLAGEWMADDEDSLRMMQRMTAKELMTSPRPTLPPTPPPHACESSTSAGCSSQTSAAPPPA